LLVVEFLNGLPVVGGSSGGTYEVGILREQLPISRHVTAVPSGLTLLDEKTNLL